MNVSSLLGLLLSAGADDLQASQMGGILLFSFRKQNRKKRTLDGWLELGDAVSPLRSMISIAASAVLTVITGLGSPS